MLTTNKTYVNIVLETRKKTIQEGEQKMKTLALQKIRERETFMLKRISHRYEQYKQGLISCEEFAEYKNSYVSHFNGYVRAFWDMELLTDEEQKQILRSFMESVEVA